MQLVCWNNTLKVMVFLLIWFTHWLPSPLAAQEVPEKLVYDLSWTGIPVGRATQEIEDAGELRRIISTARSNEWLSLFFPVDDVIESSLVKDRGEFPGQTRHYRMRMKEGRHARDREITFEPELGKAFYRDHRTGETAEIAITYDTYDIYASFYYVRRRHLEVGKSFYVKVLDGKEVETVEIKVLRREKINCIFGAVDTIVIQPLVKPKGVFEGKGTVQIWLTDDARRIPVKAQTKVRVGSVIATLTGISSGEGHERKPAHQ